MLKVFDRAQELAPVIDFLQKHLGLGQVHVDTKPHEENFEASSSEVV
jgi:hypothetical protein